jgi:hypothetical protein
VNLVPALPAVLAGLFVVAVPGCLLLALLPARDREALRLDEAAFLAISSSVALSAWIGLVLAELGRFSLVGAGLLLAGASALALLLGRRRIGLPSRAARARELLPAAVVLALAAWLQARPSQYIVGGRDPGAYIAAMGVIARTGGIVYTDPGVLSVPPELRELFFRNPQAPPFSWSRFMGFDLESPESGRVYPQFFHLFPAFGAYLFQAMGVKGALATPPIFGVLGTFSVFVALRRLFGGAPALLAALLLALNVVQVWFARYPASEGFSQFLLFFGLFALLVSEENGSPAFAAVAGSAFGLSLLVRVDSVLILLPIGLYVVIRRARGSPLRELLPLLLPLGLLLLHAALHAGVFATKYVQDIATRRYWRQPPAVWGVLALAAVLLLVRGHRMAAALRGFLRARPHAVRAAAMSLVTLLSLYAYFVRPQLSAWAAADGNDPWSDSRTNLALIDADKDGSVSREEFSRRAKRAPSFDSLDDDGDGKLTRDEWRGDPPFPLDVFGFQRLAAHDAQSLVRLGWFVSPLALLLGLMGLLLVLREWRPRYLFPVLTALSFALFYFYKLRVWHDYYFALRRFVPAVLPFLFGFLALFLVRLARGGRLRRTAAALLLLTLGARYAADTRAIARHVDWDRSVDFVRDVARRFGPSDVVLFEQPQSIHLLSLPLWAAHGVNVLELARFNPDPDRLQALVRAWRGRYRNIYFVHTYRTDLCGVFLQRLEELGFATTEWERGYRRPPTKAEPRALHFTLSRVVPPEELQVPALPEVDIGGSDDFQVSGFFGKEGGGARTYRWTGPCGSIYLPGARAGAELLVTASVGRRPADRPARTRVSLSGVPLGEIVPGAEWTEHRLRLPAPLPAGAPILRLDVPAFRPANVFPNSSDTRDLGVMIERVRIDGLTR